MTRIATRPETESRTRAERPRMWRVVLLNDDYTPRAFVVRVLTGVFRLDAERARAVMLTAHQKGACVVAVYTRDVAETRALEAQRTARAEGHPLAFRVEPED